MAIDFIKDWNYWFVMPWFIYFWFLFHAKYKNEKHYYCSLLFYFFYIMRPFNRVLMLTETVKTVKQVTWPTKCLNENDLRYLKRQVYNLTVILNKLNQTNFRISQCKYPPFPKTRFVTSLIEWCHVTLKTTAMLSSKCNSSSSPINENNKTFYTEKSCNKFNYLRGVFWL